MRVEAVEAIGFTDPASTALLSPMQSPSAAPNFGEWMAGKVLEADGATRSAEGAVRDLALGRSENLHNVMLELEQARLSVEVVVQVRNRLLEAYQEIMRMQV